MGAPNTGTIKQVATELAAEMGSTKFVDNLGDLLGAIRSETIKLHERRIPRLNFLLESLNGIVGNFYIIEIVYRNCTFWRKHQASVRLAAQLPAIARCQYAQVLSMNLVVPNRSSSAARFTMTLQSTWSQAAHINVPLFISTCAHRNERVPASEGEFA